VANVKKSGVSIRRVARSDIDTVLAIDRKISGEQGLVTYRDMVTADLGGPLDLSFVAEANGQVVGFIWCRLAYVGIPIIEVALTHMMVVDPDYQGQGIAGKLVNALLDYCQAEEIETVRMVVGERNTRLQHFFERLGFHRSALINYTKTFEN